MRSNPPWTVGRHFHVRRTSRPGRRGRDPCSRRRVRDLDFVLWVPDQDHEGCSPIPLVEERDPKTKEPMVHSTHLMYQKLQERLKVLRYVFIHTNTKTPLSFPSLYAIILTQTYCRSVSILHIFMCGGSLCVSTYVLEVCLKRF